MGQTPAWLKNWQTVRLQSVVGAELVATTAAARKNAPSAVAPHQSSSCYMLSVQDWIRLIRDFLRKWPAFGTAGCTAAVSASAATVRGELIQTRTAKSLPSQTGAHRRFPLCHYKLCSGASAISILVGISLFFSLLSGHASSTILCLSFFLSQDIGSLCHFVSPVTWSSPICYCRQ